MMPAIDLYNYSSHKRCAAFVGHYDNLKSTPKNDRAFWRDLSDFWHTMDCIDHAAIERLMYNTPYRHSHLSKARQSAIDDLFADGDLITIYRGQNDLNDEIQASGLAWTTDINVAKKFALNGIRGHTTGNPYLLHTSVFRHEVALAFNDRDESEVVLFSMELDNLNHKLRRIDL